MNEPISTPFDLKDCKVTGYYMAPIASKMPISSTLCYDVENNRWG